MNNDLCIDIYPMLDTSSFVCIAKGARGQKRPVSSLSEIPKRIHIFLEGTTVPGAVEKRIERKKN